MDLPRDAVDTQAVRTVRGDLEHQDLVAEWQQLAQRGTRRKLGVEHEDAAVVGADRELVLGEDHPVGLDPTELAHLELRAVGHHRPRPRDRDRLARADVRRTADDLRRGRAADVDHAQAEAVGVGVAQALEHAADDEVLGRGDAVVLDPLDLGAGHRQPLGERGGVELGGAVLVQPAERGAHQQNCSRKRMSLS